jgi:hypothetical protein
MSDETRWTTVMIGDAIALAAHRAFKSANEALSTDAAGKTRLVSGSTELAVVRGA